MPTRRIRVNGIVQGVGFRPFVYQLATRACLNGWVANTSAGVEIEIEGAAPSLDAFVRALSSSRPPLARIDALTVHDISPDPPTALAPFEIRESIPLEGAFQPLSPDIAICADCLRELWDPSDRRYRYPFINCTHCGPRLTIIEDIPYDRPRTTMRAFDLCPDCSREYGDPLDRRFHAQPIACPTCGPQVELVDAVAQSSVPGSAVVEKRIPRRLAQGDEAIRAARQSLAAGSIVAIKGLGGFHLACDAAQSESVAELRRRKGRADKPFALMMPDLATVEEFCTVTTPERSLLESRARPIVLVARRAGSDLADSVAPGQNRLGVMIPYTPLHALLLEPEPGMPRALVMTSGNRSEEPIAAGNAEAVERLSGIADLFLLHNRDIALRVEDSVVTVFEGESYPIRRSRGYAPLTLPFPFDSPPLLATGAELKNTFCLTRDQYAFPSPHMGDLASLESLQSYEDGIAHFERLFRIQPRAIACDLHPDLLATRYAVERCERESLARIAVQHHHAHIAACMADQRLSGDRPVIGVAFDGTGYGEDGALWGGEFLIADYSTCHRAFHIVNIPLAGGDTAVRQPWRIALAWLDHAGIADVDGLPALRAIPSPTRDLVRRQIRHRVNAPLTSSMGRLFDTVAALTGVRTEVNYEGQAAIELEARLDPHETGRYDWDISGELLDPGPVIRALVADLSTGAAVETIATRFHNGVAALVGRVSRLARERTHLNAVALSGGVWQNLALLGRTVQALRRDGFDVYYHHHVPANDGGLALGQAAVAAHRLTRP